MRRSMTHTPLAMPWKSIRRGRGTGYMAIYPYHKVLCIGSICYPLQ
jgi:hypothetical protein